VKVAFGTRLAPDLRQRVKVFAAATDQTIEDVVEAALTGYLPPTAEAADGQPSSHPESSAAPAL
jgi:predicted transcriptional regulator